MMEQNLKGDSKKALGIKKVDTKEFELPETTYIRDIDTKVFQGIILQCLSQMDGIELVEGNFIDNIFGRSATEISNGIHSEQDSSSQSVSIKIEVNVHYGVPIPEKAEEIQTKVVEEITKLTGLRVASVHIVFRNLIVSDQIKQNNRVIMSIEQLVKEPLAGSKQSQEYSEEF
jgi:uncharacterized alkaline shock family protein YloU